MIRTLEVGILLKVVAGDLDRLIQNVLLYTNSKAVRLREVFFTLGSEKMYAFSCDDYIAVGDWIEVESTEVKEFSLSLQDLERLAEWIKKDKKVIHKTEIELKFYNTYFKASADDDIEKFQYMDETNYDAWDIVFDMLSEDQPVRIIEEFAVRPDRFAKIARLKADKEAPVVFRGIDINGHLLVQFKKGLSLVGVAMPIDVERVQEEFRWKKTGPTEVSPS